MPVTYLTTGGTVTKMSQCLVHIGMWLKGLDAGGRATPDLITDSLSRQPINPLVICGFIINKAELLQPNHLSGGLPRTS